MLSRVAERTYWFARYLERVENTLRLVVVYDQLLFDLPRGMGISWYHLIQLNSAEDLFAERYRVRDERNVVKFLLADDTNPGAMLPSLEMIRENARTARDVLPAAIWEAINELSLFAHEHVRQGINRGGRHEYIDRMMAGCQQINGLLMGAMSRDACWHFLSLGRNLERADMLTRLLDAGAAAQLERSDNDDSLALSQIIWGNVLRSSSAEMSYRRALKCAVSAENVVFFLLRDPLFPRSLHYCLSRLAHSAAALPRGQAAERLLASMQARRPLCAGPLPEGEELRSHLNRCQEDLGAVHESFRALWFETDFGPHEVNASAAVG